MSSACCPKYLFRFIAVSLLVITTAYLPLSSALTAFNDSLSNIKASLRPELRKATTPPVNYRLRTVVIDAGHGGKDPGGMGANSKEKHIALSIAQKLRDMIQVNYPEIRVIMTRATDEFIPLFERAAIANREKADLFISIHANIMPGSKATYGTETFVMGQHVANYNLDVAKRENASILLEADYETNYDYDPNSDEGHILMAMYQNAFLEQSILFAELVESQFADFAGRKSRGVKQAGFVVLKATAMPSVLVEAGFMSNPKEEQYLLSDAGQQKLAAAIFEAFSAYRQLTDARGLSASTTERATYQPISNTAANSIITPPATAAPVPPSRRAQRRQKGRDLHRKSVDVSPEPAQTPQTAASSPVAVAVSKPAVLQKEVDLSSKGPTTYAHSSSPVTTETTLPAASPADDSKLVFAVQLAATKRELALTEPRWQSMTMPLIVLEEDGFFKYQVRGISNPQAAQKAKNELRNQGFENAFIVAYRDGKRLATADLQKILSQ